MSSEERTSHAPAWRVVIADDEPLARVRLRGLLRHESFTITAECANGAAVLETLQAQPADVLFLDIRMPQLDGVGVAEALLRMRDFDQPAHGTIATDTKAGAQSSLPAIVFVTAYDVHAAHAFDLEAVDYLVKPVDIDRFDRSIARIAEFLRLRDTRAEQSDHSTCVALEAAVEMLGRLAPATAFPTRFAVRDAKGVYFVAVQDIERAEAEGNYVALLPIGRRHLMRETMQNLETRLDPARFVRVHRSAIVRIDCIRRLEPWGHGEYLLTMADGARITSSRTCSAGLRRLLR